MCLQQVQVYIQIPLPQNIVTRLWTTLDPAEHHELRHFLMQHTISRHNATPTSIRNKLVKVIVLTGRADWPHEYPEFFSHILQVGVCVCLCVGPGGAITIVLQLSLPILLEGFSS